MPNFIRLIWALVVDLFRSRAALEAEVLMLRQQIVVLRRGKANLTAHHRLVLGWLCHLCPNAREALAVVRPETVNRAGNPGGYLVWVTLRSPVARGRGLCLGGRDVVDGFE
jgi:hypothetical protein